MKPKITQEYLRSIFHYDPETGVFTRLKSHRKDRVGKASGTINNHGYVQISVDNVRYLAHHLAWIYMTGEHPDQIDHINVNSADNAWLNLRKATTSQNIRNQGVRKNNTSGYKGVTYNKNAKKWLAQIKINRQPKYLGLFNCPTAAYIAYCQEANELHGEFARFA